jgi:D-lactate dehydrogenase (cytochrome)
VKKQHIEFMQVDMPVIPADAKAALFFELTLDQKGDSMALDSLRKTLVSSGANPERSWVAYEPRELERLKAFRHLLPETVNDIISLRKKDAPGLHKLGTDLSVPDEHLEKMWQIYYEECDQSGLEWLALWPYREQSPSYKYTSAQ